MDQNPYVKAANKYARDVVSGRIVACQWVKLACKRHVDDLRSAKTAAFRYKFDEEKAARVCRFVEKMPHTKGKWAAQRQRLVMAPWQVFITCAVFGWVHKKTGVRRFRKAGIIVPRKNGKSAWWAAICLYMLLADHEFGSEVYSGATTEKQAWEIFGPARMMALRTPALVSRFGLEIMAGTLSVMGTASKFEPLIGNPGDGASPHMAIHDEYHEHKTDDQVNTMETGQGAREQPLQVFVTTAGTNLAGPCYSFILESRKALTHVKKADDLFYIEYTIDDDDEWTSIAALKKANPNYDVSVSADFLKARLRDAMNNPRKSASFKTKHLNLWVNAKTAAFDVMAWRKCAKPNMKIEDYAGKRAFIGLDLASKRDIAALEILVDLGPVERTFENEDGDKLTLHRRFARFGHYFLPSETVMLPENEHYRGWDAAGLMSVTDGNITDYTEIKEAIEKYCQMFEVAGVAYDPHQATMLVTALQQEQIPVVEYRPTVLNFSEPMKTLDALMIEGLIQHTGCPVMTWQISNVVCYRDAKDNIYPRKPAGQEQLKIDNVVALISALGIALQPDKVTDSYIERQGLLVL